MSVNFWLIEGDVTVTWHGVTYPTFPHSNLIHLLTILDHQRSALANHAKASHLLSWMAARSAPHAA